MQPEEVLLRAIFGNRKYLSLELELPCGYIEKNMGRNDQVDSLLKVLVVDENSMSMDANPFEDHPTYPKPWPGPEKNVFRWYELENKQAVGWIINDEWKFIVIDLEDVAGASTPIATN